jgi:hypothetical protein
MKTSETKVRIMTDTGTVLHGAIMSLLKRGITGTYHHVGKQHLHRYLSKFDFRYNTRKITDGQRVITLIGKVAGKRLMSRYIVSE